MTPDRRSPLRLTRHLRRADIVRMALPPLKGPFTVDTYQRLGELGILGEDDRVELIDGQVVEMSPIGDRHASCVRRLNGLFARQLLDVAVIDVQNPVVLGRRDAPQPDVTLLVPRADAYPHHPRAQDILLVIEVADTTVAYDRDVKLPLYARVGIRARGRPLHQRPRGVPREHDHTAPISDHDRCGGRRSGIARY